MQNSTAVEKTDGSDDHLRPGDDFSEQLYIIYGSRTGNSKAAAELAHGYSSYLGIDSYLVDMTGLNQLDFKNFRNILLAVSTHGEGDPPAVVENFYNFIHGSDAPVMKGVRYSILALGDSSYRDFCKTGNDFRRRFDELGATEVYPLVECDIDYEENSKNWVRESVGVFQKSLPRKGVKKNESFAFEINKREADYENAWYARVIDKSLLTVTGYEKRTMHLSLSVEDFPGSFYPGDSFGVYINNSRLMVDLLIRELGYDGTTAVESAGKKKLLKEALISDYEITVLTPVVVGKYAEAANNHELKFLIKNNDFIDNYCKTRDVLDLVNDYPSDIAPQELLATLRNLTPRIYSVASSPLAVPGELHFTVGLIEYDLNKRQHRGVCSVYFEDRVEIGDSIPVFHEPNEKFRLPDDDTPVIMIGTGTGIAPYRAFLQQRKHTGAKGENWLFFGDRHRESDFLYRDEILKFHDSGLLTRLNTAFSRDQPEKEYVQHHLMKHSKEVFHWIENRKAVVYICGNKRTMGIDVKSCIEHLVAVEGNLTPEEAAEYTQDMKVQKRYRTDLY